MMILGLRVISSRGSRWSVISVFSRVNEGGRLMMWWGGVPRCVEISMYSVYSAVMSTFIPVKMIVKFDQEKVEVMINSSPTRLIDGGKARLVKLARSHQSAIRGRMVCSPRARIMVRLWVRS